MRKTSMNLRGPSGLSELSRSSLETLKGIAPPHFILNLLFSMGLLLIFVGSVGELQAQRRLDLTQYELTWSDEFSYPSKTEMFNPSTFNNNKAKWRSNLHEDPIHWENNTAVGTYTPDAISLVTKIENGQPNGYVELTPSYHGTALFPVTGNNGTVYMVNRKSAGLGAIYDGDYPCNMAPGWDLSGFHYGIFEIRAKLPNTPDTYAAYWLWNGYYDCTDGSGQGRCGEPGSSYTTCRDANNVCSNMEIDVFETSRRAANNRFDYFATIQANFNSPTPSEQCLPCATWYNWNGSNPWETYHTYTVAWTPTSMTWYLDGVEIRTQNGNVPPWRLKLFLTNTSWSTGINDPLSVDYIRVYRPKLPTTGTPLVNYTYHPASAMRSYEPGARSFDNPEAPLPVNYVAPGPKEVVYRNAWANRPHNTTKGYGAMKKVVYSSTGNASQAITSMAFYKPTSTPLQLYYLDQIGNIYQMIEPYGGFGSATQSRNLFTTLGKVGSSLTVNSAGAQMFYVASNGNVMVRNLTTPITTAAVRLNPSTSASSDDASQLVHAPAYGGILERLYYTTSTGVLAYYEKSGTTWSRKGPTNITDVAEFVVRGSAPGYRIFYTNSLNELRQVTTMSSTNVNTWQHSALSGTNSPADYDCLGGFALTPDKKRLYYKSYNANSDYIIKYWDISVVTNAVRRFEELPIDIHPESPLQAGNISASKYEVFYVSLRGRIKVHYDRLSGYNPATVNGGSYIPGKLTTSLQTFSEDDLNANTTLNPADCPTCTELLPFLAVYNVGIDTSAKVIIGQRNNSLSIGTSLPSHKPIGVHYRDNNLSIINPPNNLAKCNALDNTFGVDALTTGGNIDTNSETVYPIEGELQVYPNPSDGLIYTAVATDGECEITVIDQLGKVVYRNQSNSNTSKHDLSALPQGLYFVRLQQGSSHFTKTFLLR